MVTAILKFNENHDEVGRFASSSDRFLDISQHQIPGTRGHAPLNLMVGMEPKQRIADVPLDEIHTTQQYVDMEKIRSMMTRYGTPAWKPGSDPIVIEMAGTKYLLDGHHRLAMEALQGNKTMRSRLIWFAPKGTDSKGKLVTKAAEEDKRLVYGEVYAPNRPDVDGEFMTEADIREMAYAFMSNLRQKQVDVQHDNVLVPGCTVVESFIARDGDPDFLPGSWVVCMHVNDDLTWQKVKNGELNGFSVEANVVKVDGDVELEIPEEGVRGRTLPAVDGHLHQFHVVYGPDGKFKGGSTDVVDGHSHRIAAGTITEEANNHRHRFSSVDNLRVVTKKTA
jgi:hypothetical protein